MSESNPMAIHPTVQDSDQVSLKTKDVNLMVALEETPGITKIIRVHPLGK